MVKLPLSVLFLGILVSGCSTQTSEPLARPAHAQPPLVTQASAVAPASANEASTPEVAYSYNPVGKRDPFRVQGHTCPLSYTDLCTGQFCDYSLEELKLTGVISGLANPVAVVESPQGKAAQIYRGSKLGKNSGVVKKVLRDSIVVAEIARDGQGRSQELETVIRVRRDLPIALDDYQ